MLKFRQKVDITGNQKRMEQLQAKLQNLQFVEKAPKEVVAKNKAEVKRARRKIKKLATQSKLTIQ